MASRTLVAVALLLGCRSGEHSPGEGSARPRDSGALRKVALSRPEDDTVGFVASKFRGRNRNCNPGTISRLSPETEIPPDLVLLSVEPFSIDRRTVSCFDFDRCIESGRCEGSARLPQRPYDPANHCSNG